MSSITFFLFFIPIIALILLAINLIFALHNPYQEKNNVFECGFSSFRGQNRTQFSISFFIFALLFLLFDLEILLVYPYLVSAYTNETYGLVIILIFLLALTLGFAFELGKKALSIDSRQIHNTDNSTSIDISMLLSKIIFKDMKNIPILIMTGHKRINFKSKSAFCNKRYIIGGPSFFNASTAFAFLITFYKIIFIAGFTMYCLDNFFLNTNVNFNNIPRLNHFHTTLLEYIERVNTHHDTLETIILRDINGNFSPEELFNLRSDTHFIIHYLINNAHVIQPFSEINSSFWLLYELTMSYGSNILEHTTHYNITTCDQLRLFDDIAVFRINLRDIVNTIDNNANNINGDTTQAINNCRSVPQLTELINRILVMLERRTTYNTYYGVHAIPHLNFDENRWYLRDTDATINEIIRLLVQNRDFAVALGENNSAFLHAYNQTIFEALQSIGRGISSVTDMNDNPNNNTECPYFNFEPYSSYMGLIRALIYLILVIENSTFDPHWMNP